jgi:PAS domain S-box-containing protein
MSQSKVVAAEPVPRAPHDSGAVPAVPFPRLAQLHDLVMLVDVHGSVIYTNEHGRGTSSLHSPGHAVYELLPQADRPRYQLALNRALHAGQSDEFEHQTPDGSWWLARVIPLTDDDAQPTALILSTDITRRKQLAEERDLLFGLSLDGLCVGATDGFFKRVNPAFERMLGYSSIELLSRPFLSFVDPVDRRRTIRQLFALAAGCDVRDLEIRMLARDGTVRRCSWSCPAPRPGGDRLFAVVRDVTERREAEDQKREQEARLEHVTRLSAMGEMIAGIAHEIQQPLFAISNFAAACTNVFEQEGAVPVDKVAGWTQEISQQASRARTIIDRLRRFARKHTPKRALLSLRDLIRESLALVAAEARQHRVRVHYQPNGPALRVLVDPIQLQQVLVNLLRNAYEAVAVRPPSERDVSVWLNASGAEARVSVADSGIGLLTPEVERVFQAFYTTKPRGLGLGLAISRSIIEAHGGHLSAVARKPRGAIFTFTLPLGAAPEAEEPGA